MIVVVPNVVAIRGVHDAHVLVSDLTLVIVTIEHDLADLQPILR